jgi:hypothetical protein
VLAARGARETDGGTEPVADATLVAAMRRKARTVYVKTTIAAVVSTLVITAVMLL